MRNYVGTLHRWQVVGTIEACCETLGQMDGCRGCESDRLTDDGLELRV